MQLVNNPFKVGWRKKNADIICYMFMSLVYLQQGQENMKVVNIDEDILYNFGTTWGISMKFSVKMCLRLIF